MEKRNKAIVMFTTVLPLLLASTNTLAEDWAISAIGSCVAALGNTTNSGGGLRASGGAAVVKCPMTKEVGANTINNVYARLRRSSATGPDPFCYVYNTSNYGSPTSFANTFASDTTANQSLNINLGTQYSFGYADTYCVLNEGDTLFGVRYIQDN